MKERNINSDKNCNNIEGIYKLEIVGNHRINTIEKGNKRIRMLRVPKNINEEVPDKRKVRFYPRIRLPPEAAEIFGIGETMFYVYILNEQQVLLTKSGTDIPRTFGLLPQIDGIQSNCSGIGSIGVLVSGLTINSFGTT